MLKASKKLIAVLLSACLITPISVHASNENKDFQSTERIPNNPIDVSPAEISYDLEDENGKTVWAEDGTVTYEGIPINISGYAKLDGWNLPRVEYSLSIEGDNVRKTLVKEGYTELKNIYNDGFYNFQDENNNHTILGSTLLSVYQVGKRLGMTREHVEPFIWIFLDITDDFTVEELKTYPSMTEFVKKTGYMQTDDIYKGLSPGYVSPFENTVLEEAQEDGFNDVKTYMDNLCYKEEYEKWGIEKETWYPVYFIVSKDLVSRELAESVADKHSNTLLEKDGFYYFKDTSTEIFLDYVDIYARNQLPIFAEELNINRNQITYTYEPELRDVYHTYYSFTSKELIDAIAAEMDTWFGHWDFYLYGDEHFDYWYEKESPSKPGYLAGNWGYGFSVIQDQQTVTHEPEYKYTITGPGKVTIKIKGRENQNGYGSVNLKGEKSISLNVISNAEGEWVLTDNKWWYRHADGSYTTSDWELINGLWYFFDNDGYMKTGWTWVNGSCYYLHEDGHMASDETIDGCYVNSSGVWVQDAWVSTNNQWWYRHGDGSYTTNDWEFINGLWYFFDNDGYMKTGWTWVNGSCYYLHEDGHMASDETIDGCYVNSSGVWVQDAWVSTNNQWWYRHGDGSYTTNDWEFINGLWYFFDNDGYMKTGWTWINGSCYYLHEDGHMASDEIIDGYYVNSSGIWVS